MPPLAERKRRPAGVQRGRRRFDAKTVPGAGAGGAYRRPTGANTFECVPSGWLTELAAAR